MKSKEASFITQLKHQKQNGKVYDYYGSVYSADTGHAHYDKERLNCGRRPKWADTDAFINWADDKMIHEKWSPDVVGGFASNQGLFSSTHDCFVKDFQQERTATAA